MTITRKYIPVNPTHSRFVIGLEEVGKCHKIFVNVLASSREEPDGTQASSIFSSLVKISGRFANSISRRLKLRRGAIAIEHATLWQSGVWNAGLDTAISPVKAELLCIQNRIANTVPDDTGSLPFSCRTDFLLI